MKVSKVVCNTTRASPCARNTAPAVTDDCRLFHRFLQPFVENVCRSHLLPRCWMLKESVLGVLDSVSFLFVMFYEGCLHVSVRVDNFLSQMLKLTLSSSSFTSQNVKSTLFAELPRCCDLSSYSLLARLLTCCFMLQPCSILLNVCLMTTMKALVKTRFIDVGGSGKVRFLIDAFDWQMLRF